jgi:hypothetical protein
MLCGFIENSSNDAFEQYSEINVRSGGAAYHAEAANL